MSVIDLFVIAAGVGLIGAVNWWFFIAGRQTSPSTSRNDATAD